MAVQVRSEAIKQLNIRASELLKFLKATDAQRLSIPSTAEIRFMDPKMHKDTLRTDQLRMGALMDPTNADKVVMQVQWQDTSEKEYEDIGDAKPLGSDNEATPTR